MILALLALAAPQASAASYVIARSQCASGTCTMDPNDGWSLGYTTTPTLTTTRTSTGVYKFSMSNIGTNLGNVQVVAAGTANNTCSSSTWTSTTTGLDVEVRCFNASGSAKDSDFIFYYQYHGSGTWAGYGEAAHVSTTASTIRQRVGASFNSKGSTNTISKTGTGTYQVTFPGMTTSNATLILSTTGGSANRCRISNFTTSSAGAVLDVACANTAGTATDTGFSLSYTAYDQAHGVAFSNDSGWGAWATISSAAAVSNCTNRDGGLQMAVNTCDVTATRTTTGKYTVHIPFQDWVNSAPLVSSKHTAAGYCVVEDWDANTTLGGVDVKVNCYNSAGTLTNTAFTLSYNTWYGDWMVIK